MSSTQRSRFPKTSLKVAKLIHVDKTVGILRDAIEDDVEYLLHHFRSVTSTLKSKKGKNNPT